MNYKFHDWVIARHPENEGMFDTAKRWGQNAAMAGALAGGAAGCAGGNCPNPDKQFQSSSYTSPDAASYLPQQQGTPDSKEFPSSSTTSSDAASYLPPAQKRSQFQNAFHSPSQQKTRQDMQTKRNQMSLQSGVPQQGTFVQGQLQR